MGIAKMRTQLKGQILPLLERRGRQQCNVTDDNITLLDPKGHAWLHFNVQIPKDHLQTTRGQECGRGGSEITPVAGFKTILTVGTKIPLGEI